MWFSRHVLFLFVFSRSCGCPDDGHRCEHPPYQSCVMNPKPGPSILQGGICEDPKPLGLRPTGRALLAGHVYLFTQNGPSPQVGFTAVGSSEHLIGW